MTGRAEVERHRKQLEATLARAALLSDPEILSDFARHLCVLVSGFLEQAVIELLLEYARIHSHPAIQRHVEHHLRQFTNAKAARLTQLLGTFDDDWRVDLENYLVGEYKDAVDGIVDLRHRIAHGKFVGVTMARVQDYYVRIKKVVDHIADLCLPV